MKIYLTNSKVREFVKLYGMTQNPDTKDYILVQNNSLFINWISGNEKIDNFIREIQLKINNHDDIIFEWVPYNQLNQIKEIKKNDFITVHSAIWKDGPLGWNEQNKNYTRNSNNEVALKCLHNSQNLIEVLINEV